MIIECNNCGNKYSKHELFSISTVTKRGTEINICRKCTEELIEKNKEMFGFNKEKINEVKV